jgi:hypothetical protein
MNTKLTFLSIGLFAAFAIQAQCPTAAVVLATQAEVNAFPTTYAGCTAFPDGVDLEVMGLDITDLSPLTQLTSIGGILEIRDCPILSSLTGLNNLTSVGNDALDGFILRDLPALTNLSGLSSLTKVTGEFTVRTCNALTDLTGLNNVDTANGSLIIRDNANLTTLSGLESLVHIGETLELVQNYALTSVAALSNVNSIVGGPEGGIFIEANTVLTNLTGLGNNSTTVGGNLDLAFNDDLSLCAVPSICNYLANPPVGAIITINANIVGCNTEAEIQAGCVALSIDETASGIQADVYPNPVNNWLNIKTADNKQKLVEVLNVIGEKVAQFNMNNTIELNILNYSNGVYFIKITSNSQQQTLKFVKQ